MTQYLQLAMSVENKWGNTKFLLSQLIPGKEPLYKSVTMSKSHVECFQILDLDADMLAKAALVDDILGLNTPHVPHERINSLEEEGAKGKKATGATKDKTTKKKFPKSPSRPSSSGFERSGRVALAV